VSRKSDIVLLQGRGEEVLPTSTGQSNTRSVVVTLKIGVVATRFKFQFQLKLS